MDAKKIYATLYGETFAPVKIDVASGQTRTLIQREDLSVPALAPDGRLLAVRSNDRSTHSSVILLVSVADGGVKELLRVGAPQSFQGNSVSWTADGRAIIVKKIQGGQPYEVLMVPTGGGEPRKLEITVPGLTAAPVRANVDGRQIAFTAGQDGWEVSALEHFLAPPTSKK